MRAAVVLIAVAACSDAPEVLFPESYAASYTEVRGCRASSDHDLNKIRVLVDPAALAPYTMRAGDFPVGAVVLKEEYDFADSTCTGELVQWTVMKRIAGTLNGGWRWQRVLREGREVVSEDEDSARCINCHSQCGVPPDGYLGTCTIPP